MLGVVLIAGCLGGGAPSPDVALRDDYFEPDTITTTAGENLTFQNLGRYAHTLTVQEPGGDAGEYLFHREPVRPDERIRYAFSSPGTYDVFCVYHSQGAQGNFSGGMVMRALVA